MAGQPPDWPAFEGPPSQKGKVTFSGPPDQKPSLGSKTKQAPDPATSKQPIRPEPSTPVPPQNVSLLPPQPQVHENANDVGKGILLTCCSCWICLGKACGETAQDCGSATSTLRRACVSSTVMYILAVLFVIASWILIIFATAWSSAYYSKHYKPTAMALKLNATRANATSAAKDAYAVWKADPIWDFFPMQKRYYLPCFFMHIAIIFAMIQTFETPRVNDELCGVETEEDSAGCLWCLRAVNCCSKACSLIWWLIGASIAIGYLIMAVSFLDDVDSRTHTLVPVSCMAAECCILSMALAWIYIGKWISYRNSIRHTRAGADDEDVETKLM